MAEHDDIGFEQLVDWVEGRLSAAESAQLAQQVAAAGPTVQAQVEWLRAFVRVRGKLTLATPPPSVRQTLSARFAEYAQKKRQPSFFTRLSAALTFDSALQPAAANLRGKAVHARQLVFSTDRLDIVLNVQPRPQDERLDLLGQLLPNRTARLSALFAVQVLQQESEIAIGVTDDLGEFEFAALAPGVYQIMISGDELEITLPAIELSR